MGQANSINCQNCGSLKKENKSELEVKSCN